MDAAMSTAPPTPDAGEDRLDETAGTAGATGEGDGAGRGRLGAWVERTGRANVALDVLTVLIVAGAVVFTVAQLHPRLLVTNTTPAGGDMGAHVWGPAYLRDVLLPSGRLSGWTPDWYAGFPAYHFYMVVPALLIVALDVVLPYGIAFKLVTVLGVLTLPVSAAVMARLMRLPFPGPALFAVGATFFLFDRNFTIYGGNIPSTLAGEFSFTISLSLCLLYLGVLARGLETGRHRGLAAGLLGVAILCHAIPVVFAGVATLVLLAMHLDRRRIRWALPIGLTAFALTAFWAVPFLWRRGYMTDMGWEKRTSYLQDLFPNPPDFPFNFWWVAALAAAGAIAAIGLRRRAGIFLVAVAALMALAFIVLPQGRLWNARLLGFWYLSCYLLAAVAVAEVARAISTLVARDPDRPPRAVTAGLTVAVVVVGWVALALPLRALPGGSVGDDGSYRWLFLETTDRSFIPGWARWNYEGYEAKAAWPEYSGIVGTMADLGRTDGCGRAMWEHEPEHDRFGTPMALMLLPYWTGGCIGSMEGLYFESSATTPFHFLNQSLLSARPSRPQRGLPYEDLDVDRGVKNLQLLGVRYYMAFSERAVEQAEANPDLDLVATFERWRVYEVAGSDLVVPLEHEPAVLTDVPSAGSGWEDAAVDFYVHPDRWDVLLATRGPDGWQRIAQADTPDRRPVRPVRITDVERGTHTIGFRVDEPGSPVLVRESYFPNWKVSGGEGPFRVTPNLMVVVPTSETVELRYGWTPVDIGSWLVTLAGVAGLVLLVRAGPVPLPVRAPGPRWRRGPEPDEPAAGDGSAPMTPDGSAAALAGEGEAQTGEPDHRADGPPGDRAAGRPALLDDDRQLLHGEPGVLDPQDQLGVEQVGAEAARLDQGGDPGPVERLDAVGVGHGEPEPPPQHEREHTGDEAARPGTTVAGARSPLAADDHSRASRRADAGDRSFEEPEVDEVDVEVDDDVAGGGEEPRP